METNNKKNSSSNRASLRKLRKQKTKERIFAISMKGLEIALVVLRIVELLVKHFKRP